MPIARPSHPVLSSDRNTSDDLCPSHLSLPMIDFPRKGHVFVETPAPISRVETRRSDASTLLSEPHSPEYHMQAALQALQQPRPRKLTQAEQDARDEESRKKVLKELMTSWNDRLTNISVITTFFAAIEAQILDILSPDPSSPFLSAVGRTAAVTLSSALVVHLFAATISFIAAFFLVRYRVREASRAEHKVEKELESNSNPSSNSDPNSGSSAAEAPDPVIFSANPHIEEVGPFRRGKPPTKLLEHCHTLCMILAAVGFILAKIGVLCFIWAVLPVSARVVGSVFMGLCIIGFFCAVVLPAGMSLDSPSHVVG